MTVILLCPQCSQAIEAHHDTPDECPHCGSLLSEQLGTAVRVALARQIVPKPFLLRLLTFFLGFWGVLALVIVGTNIFAENTTYTVDGVSVTREQFLERAAGLLVVLPVVVLLALVAAWALYRERTWGRHTVFAMFAVSFLGSVLSSIGDQSSQTMLPMQLGFALLMLALIGWYLYGKRSVVAYYRALARGAGGRDDGVASPAI